jgi:heterodisulfide reductase subunit A
MQTQEAMLNLAAIDPWLCKGCGNCAVSCPVKAINIPHESDVQILDQIEAALAGYPKDFSLPVMVFGCEWSGYAAAEVAGARKLSYPVDTRLIRLSCSSRFDPLFALWAFFNGANGVLITACPPGKCHHIHANQSLQARVQTLHQWLIGYGYDPRRLKLEWMSPDDPVHFVETVTEFTNLMRALGSNLIQCTQGA